MIEKNGCFFFGLMYLLLLYPLTLNGNSETHHPNILIIYADDLGYGDLSSYGGNIPTPHIDKIGKEGIRFTSFYVSAPACTPSRYSLMTGAYPQRSHHGLNRVIYSKHSGRLDEKEKILPQYLKQIGYHTALFGKWHLGGNPLDHGFDRFSGLTQGCIDYYNHVAVFPHSEGNYALDWYNGYNKVKEEGYATDLITEHAIDYLNKKSKSGAPFFIYLAYNAPHYGKSVAKLVEETGYTGNTISLDGDDPREFEGVFSSLQAPEEYLHKFSHVSDIYRRYYAAMISSMDDNIGRVWENLKKNHLLNNTIIWFISDNGGYSVTHHAHADNGDLRGQKFDVYEGGIRVPALLCWKNKIKAGLVCHQPVLNADLLPTFAMILGFEQQLTNRTIDGKNISTVIFENDRLERSLFWRYDVNKQYAYRKGNWKLYMDQLFNLETDIQEKHNVKSKNPEKYKELKNAYDSTLRSLTPFK